MPKSFVRGVENLGGDEGMLFEGQGKFQMR